MVDSKKLKHFSVLAKLGNYSAAADALNISQPALSRSIQALEGRLSLKLIDRSQRIIQLTRAGQHLLELAHGILLNVENFEQEAEKLRGLMVGKLNIGSGPFPAEHVGAKACAQFLRDYPNIQLSLSVEEPERLAAKLIQGEMDLILADQRAVGEDPSLEFRPLPGVPVVVVARKGHPLTEKSALTFNDLKDYSHASISQASTRLLASALGVTETADIASLATFSCNSVDVMLSTIRQSDATGSVLRCHVDNPEHRHQLSILDFPQLASLSSQYGILTYRARLLSIPAEKFIGIIEQMTAE